MSVDTDTKTETRKRNTIYADTGLRVDIRQLCVRENAATVRVSLPEHEVLDALNAADGDKIKVVIDKKNGEVRLEPFDVGKNE